MRFYCNTFGLYFVVLLVAYCCTLVARFTELSRSDPIEALTYLQKDLAEIVNHDNPDEREEVSDNYVNL